MIVSGGLPSNEQAVNLGCREGLMVYLSRRLLVNRGARKKKELGNLSNNFDRVSWLANSCTY